MWDPENLLIFICKNCCGMVEKEAKTDVNS
jgi:hypothetical protein